MQRIAICFLLFVFAQSVYSQNIGEPVRLGLGAGDTLRAPQNDKIGLLPSVRGFRWAVFFLGADSVLSAEVLYGSDRGFLADTIIVGFTTLRNMHLELRKAGLSSTDSAKVVLDDGSLISGEVLGETPTKLIVYSRQLGQLPISWREIRKIERREPDHERNYYRQVTDPNNTRAFLMPTASTPAAGQGYVGDYELIFFNAAVGVTDWLMVNGGTVLLPLPAEYMVFDYGFKARFFHDPNRLSLAVGLQMLGGRLIENVSGIAYWIASVGDDNTGANFAIGDAFSGSGGTLVLGVSGSARVSESIKVMAEMWISDHGSTVPLVVGVRFFGNRLSGDLGLLYPIGEQLNSPIGIPVGSLTYSF